MNFINPVSNGTSTEAAHDTSPPSKIEITPEMIEAGVRVLNRHTSDEHRVLPDEDIILQIVRAVEAAA
jgi:hypothetical protein